jgi:cathepsin A (carboxypeptidase C)
VEGILNSPLSLLLTSPSPPTYYPPSPPPTQTGLNPYDIRKECGDNPLCYDFSNVEKWLTTDSTREALHVSDEASDWVSCNNNVNADFRQDWMINYDSYIADMLEGDIDVLIYAGDVDFICNSLGNKAWTLDLEWSGKEGFNALEDKVRRREERSSDF